MIFKEQIEYAKTQEWFPLFLKYFDPTYASKYTIRIDDTFIKPAFDWGNSPEGFKYWEAIHEEILFRFPIKLSYLEFIIPELGDDYPELFV